MSKPTMTSMADARGLRRWLVCLLMCSAAMVSAQTQVEYFWDTDPGFGRGSIVKVSSDAGTDACNVTFDVSAAHLSPGLHTLGLRSMNTEGEATHFSPTIICNMLVAKNNIRTEVMEYFWDKDPGFGKGTMVKVNATDAETNVAFDVSASGLAEGVHTLFFRSFADGWSPTMQYLVYVKAGKATQITAVEYFWDKDPGFGKGTMVDVNTVDTEVDIMFDADASGLSEGVHTLFFRSFADGWSPTVQYAVLVKNEEVHPITAVEYFWDEDPGFGKATPVDFTSGNTVDIDNLVLDVNGMIGDHLLCVRAFSNGGWSPLLMKTVSCTVEGSFTLNEQLEEGAERNYRSLDEMFDDFVARRVTSNVTVTVRDGATFAFDATSAEAMAKLAAVAGDMVESDSRITFKSGSKATINITAVDDIEVMKSIIAFSTRISLEKVVLNINGSAYDFSVLGMRADEICSGGENAPMEWSAINENMSASWVAKASSKAYVKGYTASGEGDLPVMTLTNTGDATDYVDYNVTLKYGETDVYAFVYKIYVKPSIAGKQVTLVSPTPNDGTMVDPGTTTIKWNKVGGATSYVVKVDCTLDSNGTVNTTTTTVTENSMSITLETGKTYKYTVKAVGPCDETPESSRTMITFRANADDVASLKVLYDALGGTGWTKQWVFNSEVMQSTNFPGVTFNSDGRVAGINLTGFGLTGSLDVNGFALPMLTSLNLSRNNLGGNVHTSLLAECPAIASLDLSYNQLTEVADALPQSITALNLGSQHRVYGNNSAMKDLSGMDVLEFDLNVTIDSELGQTSLMTYNHSSQNHTAKPTYELRNATLNESYARLTYSNGVYYLSFLNKDYKLAQNAEVVMVQTSGTANGSIQKAILRYMEADANVDRAVDVLDVQHTLNYVASNSGASGLFNYSAANTFEDDDINIQDIVVTVNKVFDGEDLSVNARSRNLLYGMGEKSHGRLFVKDGYLCLECDSVAAAMDIALEGVDEDGIRLMLNRNDFQMMVRNTSNGVRLVVFSPNGGAIPAGTTKLLYVGGEATVAAVQVADMSARNLAIDIDGQATGIGGVNDEMPIRAYFSDDVLVVKANADMSDVNLTLHDANGRTGLRQLGTTLHAGENTFAVANLSRGVYLLNVSYENKTWKLKIRR